MKIFKFNISVLPLFTLLIVLNSCDDAELDNESRMLTTNTIPLAVVKKADSGTMRTGTPGTEIPQKLRFSKVLSVTMTVNSDSSVTLTNPSVFYGKPPNNIGNPAMFTARLFDQHAKLVNTVSLWDPRWTFVWRNEEDNDYVAFAEKEDVVIIVPFKQDYASLDIVKGIKDKTSLAYIDVTETITVFCKKHPNDPDCSKRPERLLLNKKN